MTQVEICNLALGWVGAELITSIDDATTPARLCKAGWASTRDVVLAAHVWGFAKRRAVIPPDATPPAFGRLHRFQIPSDSVRIASVKDTFGDHVDRDIEGTFILADATPLYVVYVSRVESTADLPAYFGQALATLLASNLAIPLAQNEGAMASWFRAFQIKVAEAAAADGAQAGPVTRPVASRFVR